MIQTVIVQINGVDFKKTFSDTGVKIIQSVTHRLYDEAIDTVTATYTYTESSIPVTVPEE